MSVTACVADKPVNRQQAACSSVQACAFLAEPLTGRTSDRQHPTAALGRQAVQHHVPNTSLHWLSMHGLQPLKVFWNDACKGFLWPPYYGSSSNSWVPADLA
jgi:hypothetical protein